MPALDFPSSPTNGQVYGQYTYDSTKGAWRVTANPGATVVSSPTAPSSPVAGNLWLNTNDGVLFVYYNDGDTSQWVEVKSNTASGSTVAARVDALEAKPSGLVPITPASIAVNTGTASVGANGKVTFSSIGSLSLNGIFSSAYQNYVIQFTTTSTTGNDSLNLRLRSGGTDLQGATSYIFTGMETVTAGGGIGQRYSNGTTSWHAGFGYTTYGTEAIIDIKNPFVSGIETGYFVTSMGQLSSGNYADSVNGRTNGATGAYESLTIFGPSFLLSGNCQVYGYR